MSRSLKLVRARIPPDLQENFIALADKAHTICYYINRADIKREIKGRKSERVLVVTHDSCFICKVSGEILRRIGIERIDALYIDIDTDTLVIRVPLEYDAMLATKEYRIIGGIIRKIHDDNKKLRPLQISELKPDIINTLRFERPKLLAEDEEEPTFVPLSKEKVDQLISTNIEVEREAERKATLQSMAEEEIPWEFPLGADVCRGRLKLGRAMNKLFKDYYFDTVAGRLRRFTHEHSPTADKSYNLQEAGVRLPFPGEVSCSGYPIIVDGPNMDLICLSCQTEQLRRKWGLAIHCCSEIAQSHRSMYAGIAPCDPAESNAWKGAWCEGGKLNDLRRVVVGDCFTSNMVINGDQRFALLDFPFLYIFGGSANNSITNPDRIGAAYLRGCTIYDTSAPTGCKKGVKLRLTVPLSPWDVTTIIVLGFSREQQGLQFVKMVTESISSKVPKTCRLAQNGLACRWRNHHIHSQHYFHQLGGTSKRSWGVMRSAVLGLRIGRVPKRSSDDGDEEIVNSAPKPLRNAFRKSEDKKKVGKAGEANGVKKSGRMHSVSVISGYEMSDNDLPEGDDGPYDRSNSTNPTPERFQTPEFVIQRPEEDEVNEVPQFSLNETSSHLRLSTKILNSKRTRRLSFADKDLLRNGFPEADDAIEDATVNRPSSTPTSILSQKSVDEIRNRTPPSSININTNMLMFEWFNEMNTVLCDSMALKNALYHDELKKNVQLFSISNIQDNIQAPHETSTGSNTCTASGLSSVHLNDSSTSPIPVMRQGRETSCSDLVQTRTVMRDISTSMSSVMMEELLSVRARTDAQIKQVLETVSSNAPTKDEVEGGSDSDSDKFGFDLVDDFDEGDATPEEQPSSEKLFRRRKTFKFTVRPPEADYHTNEKIQAVKFSERSDSESDCCDHDCSTLSVAEAPPREELSKTSSNDNTSIPRHTTSFSHRLSSPPRNEPETSWKSPERVRDAFTSIERGTSKTQSLEDLINDIHFDIQHCINNVTSQARHSSPRPRIPGWLSYALETVEKCEIHTHSLSRV